jgi:hypothetical protein
MKNIMPVSRRSFTLSTFLKSLTAILFLGVSLSMTLPVASPQANSIVASSSSKPVEASTTTTSGIAAWAVEDLSPQVLQLALQAVAAAEKQGINSGKVLGIIDFSLPSTKRRFWVLDLEHRKVLFHELVAHGKGSGENFATSFSNLPSSYQSSLGLYLTGSTYEGNHGYSLRLQGLEQGFNDRAEARAIVLHGAWYVSQSMIDQNQRIGRSQGCPAVQESVVKPIIDTLKNGNLIFAYYPDKNWLSTSKFISH